MRKDGRRSKRTRQALAHTYMSPSRTLIPYWPGSLNAAGVHAQVTGDIKVSGTHSFVSSTACESSYRVLSSVSFTAMPSCYRMLSQTFVLLLNGFIFRMCGLFLVFWQHPGSCENTHQCFISAEEKTTFIFKKSDNRDTMLSYRVDQLVLHCLWRVTSFP